MALASAASSSAALGLVSRDVLSCRRVASGHRVSLLDE
jgi:hypothetical protein